MAEYHEDIYQGDILRKLNDTNEFIVTYQVSIYGGCEFGCAYCDGWSYSNEAIN